jgi:hypothetical protein
MINNEFVVQDKEGLTSNAIKIIGIISMTYRSYGNNIFPALQLGYTSIVYAHYWEISCANYDVFYC